MDVRKCKMTPCIILGTLLRDYDPIDTVAFARLLTKMIAKDVRHMYII